MSAEAFTNKALHFENTMTLIGRQEVWIYSYTGMASNVSAIEYYIDSICYYLDCECIIRCCLGSSYYLIMKVAIPSRMSFKFVSSSLHWQLQ